MFHQLHVIRALQLEREHERARAQARPARGRSVRRWWRRIGAQALGRRPARVQHA
jgi:hypothetical protein